MIANLTTFLAHELGFTNDGPDSEAYHMLNEGAEFMEPDLVLNLAAPEFITIHRQFIHGQSARLMNYKLLSCPMSLTAGYIAEHNDHHEAVIALRRMTARGA